MGGSQSLDPKERHPLFPAMANPWLLSLLAIVPVGVALIAAGVVIVNLRGATHS